MKNAFQSLSIPEKIMILFFLRNQPINGIHFTLKESGKQYFLKKYPKEFSEESDADHDFAGTIAKIPYADIFGTDIKEGLTGKIEDVSNDVLRIKKLHCLVRYANRWYDPLDKVEFLIPIELIDDIKIIK